MDLDVKVKEEPICFEETSNNSCCEKDRKIEIKVEPVWLEGTATTSLDNYKIISEEMHLKEEPKSELAEPRETQPSTNIKDEICVDEHTVSQLVACFKEKDRFGNVALLTEVPEGSCNTSCNILKNGSEVMCILPTHNDSNQDVLRDPEASPIHPIRQRAFCCNECASKFPLKSRLRRHLLTHTGDRPYSCYQCNRKFSQKSHLRQHLLTHTNERPHSCKICSKKFSHKVYLRDHQITHTVERPLSCHQCDKKFARRTSLRQHMLTHTDERPHSCETCGKKFSHSDYLRKHLVIHAGAGPHSCETCGRKFFHKSSLRRHLVIHTSDGAKFMC